MGHRVRSLGPELAGVTEDQRLAAQLLADAGYDLVIGHHPHIVQEVEILDGMPVLYSLGNLAFGTPGRFEAGAEGYGLIARTGFGPNGRMDIRLDCIVTDNEIVEFQPEPCAAAEARRLFSQLGSAVHTLKVTPAWLTWISKTSRPNPAALTPLGAAGAGEREGEEQPPVVGDPRGR